MGRTARAGKSGQAARVPTAMLGADSSAKMACEVLILGELESSFLTAVQAVKMPSFARVIQLQRLGGWKGT